jgi:hypothetical protein
MMDDKKKRQYFLKQTKATLVDVMEIVYLFKKLVLKIADKKT